MWKLFVTERMLHVVEIICHIVKSVASGNVVMTERTSKALVSSVM